MLFKGFSFVVLLDLESIQSAFQKFFPKENMQTWLVLSLCFDEDDNVNVDIYDDIDINVDDNVDIFAASLFISNVIITCHD